MDGGRKERAVRVRKKEAREGCGGLVAPFPLCCAAALFPRPLSLSLSFLAIAAFSFSFERALVNRKYKEKSGEMASWTREPLSLSEWKRRERELERGKSKTSLDALFTFLLLFFRCRLDGAPLFSLAKK